jgi:hypothetical protein
MSAARNWEEIARNRAVARMKLEARGRSRDEPTKDELRKELEKAAANTAAAQRRADKDAR